MVAAGHRVTAEAGAEVLRAGGSAVDAAVAALAAACVAEPVLCSPGGGGFALLRDGATGEVRVVDFFPQTPRARRQEAGAGEREIVADFGTATQAFHIGPATAAMPGFFAGIEAMRGLAGRLPLGALFAPAIRAARDGVIVTPFQHYLATVVLPILTATQGAAALYAPGGRPHAAGSRFRNPGLAAAFAAVAAEGFVGGGVEAAMIAAQAEGGHLTAADAAAYRAELREPLEVTRDGARVWLNPAPAAGGVLVADSLERCAGPEPLAMARALAASDAARRDPGSALAGRLAAPLRARGTTHVSVIDGDGNACAVTVSNGEGNGTLVGGFGFMLNNMLGEEDVNPAGRDWPLDARLASMMCPALVETADGALTVLGSGGSNRIRSAILQAVLRLCRPGVALGEAIAAPRLHPEGGHLDFEEGFAAEARAALVAAFPDHRGWAEPNMFFGGVHAVRRAADGTLSGAGDARRDGVVVGA